jgi:hypothetical protein
MFLGKSCLAFSLEDTTFKGDLRLRYQYDHKEMADSSAQRHRGRGRLRFGFETRVRDDVTIGVRLASGQTDNRSTNQTYADFFTTKELRLDRAYAAWQPAEEIGFLFGKYNRAFLIVDDLIWDGDINFEGASVLWERGPGGSFGGLANAGFFLLDEDKSSARDPHMFYIQPGLSFSAGDHFSGKMGVVYYDFEHVKGMVPNEDLSSGTNTRVDGRLKYGYDSLNPNLVLAYATGGPGGHGYTLTFIGDYIYNFEAKDSGFLVGARAGHSSVKKRASWIAYYNYRRLERDAFMDVFPDSDFYGGATNVRGHEFVFQYAVVQNVVMGLDYYRAEKLDGDSAPLNTLQIDCVFRF